MLKTYSVLLPSLILALLLSGCAQLGQMNLTRMFQSFGTNAETGKTATLRTEADFLLDQGQTARALDRLQQGLDDGTDPGQIAQQQIRAINQLLDQAEQEYHRQFHLEAGLNFRKALIHYPGQPALQEQLTASIDEIRGKIDQCANQLLEDGLLAYRAGSLEAAIDVWSQIRQFHPEYKASQQAIRTTRIQLKNLETINPGSTANGS